MPNEVLYRKKRGFNIPIKEWALDSIVNYNELVEEINYEKSFIGIEDEENPFMIPVPDNINSNNVVDSLSYSIAQLFYYNFNIKDSAIIKF